ncbi:c-type cytochrome [Niastella sp. OAS944]|uniref:c-type cytochrome n=1 Tax=Niastella sp. OAS944 TaxID=2664089 RepID=UPI003480E403|nr:thiosulfate dehydrogenase [Chitinophagaceae bacterium OAS944]
MNRNMVFGFLAIGISVAVWLTVTNRKAINKHQKIIASEAPEMPWQAPDSNTIPHTTAGVEVRYGRDLIARTSYYLGPNGTVAHTTNGMNCQNCHLAAGTKPYGNNYSAVSSTYPKYRDRSGTVETIDKRVNDCIERSLNGKPLDTNSREMRAIVAYMHWLGTNVAKGNKPLGSGISSLKDLARAADGVKGKLVFIEKCQLCHGANGAGQPDTVTHVGYLYPPLWGPHSYNVGAGLYRLSRMAGYVKDNMPFGVSHGNSQLTDEQAWDVAAFINAQPRPGKDLSKDWPKISSKPFDHPFGPYSDTFSELQHKYGPFGPIKKAKESGKK